MGVVIPLEDKVIDPGVSSLSTLVAADMAALVDLELTGQVELLPGNRAALLR